ncbi:MAG: hypothetical protein DSY82_06605 [Flavobacteriia bacterium]|nr:MAG: hypothetical protein DSY82_06605 [Flavobacteriia bacterium]
MKKLLLLFVPLLFIQCKQNDTAIIKKNDVGGITKNTTKEQLFKLFEEDSIVKIPEGKNYVNEYAIFKKGGEHLLTVYPLIPKDSTQFIERVQIFSPKYKTEKGVSTSSVFKDVNANYTIKKIDPTFTSALVYIDELNATIALNKKDLGLKELDMNMISKDQVPDQAKIKYIDIWFN